MGLLWWPETDILAHSPRFAFIRRLARCNGTGRTDEAGLRLPLQIRKLSADLAVAERRASKATRKAATLGKLLAREHSLRVAAEAARAVAVAHLADSNGILSPAERQPRNEALLPVTGGSEAAATRNSGASLSAEVSHVRSPAMPFVRQMEAAVLGATPNTSSPRLPGSSPALARLGVLCCSPLPLAFDLAADAPAAAAAANKVSREACRSHLFICNRPIGLIVAVKQAYRSLGRKIFQVQPVCDG